MDMNQSLKAHLKRKGFDTKKMSYDNVVSKYKELYYLNITKKTILKEKQNYVPIIKNEWVIYVLVHLNEIVYVGISKHVLYRVGEHQKTNKVFDSVYVKRINLYNEEPEIVEYKFISKFKPKYNHEIMKNNSIVNFINENIY